MMTLQQLFQYPALPEIALLLMTCVILLLDLFFWFIIDLLLRAPPFLKDELA